MWLWVGDGNTWVGQNTFVQRFGEVVRTTADLLMWHTVALWITALLSRTRYFVVDFFS